MFTWFAGPTLAHAPASTLTGGMTSSDLALEVNNTISACVSRVMGVGDKQYSMGDRQKFEDMPISELIEWANEELEDTIVYAVMLRIRLARLQVAFDKSFENYALEYTQDPSSIEEC